jgi:hypothetical protein
LGYCPALIGGVRFADDDAVRSGFRGGTVIGEAETFLGVGLVDGDDLPKFDFDDCLWVLTWALSLGMQFVPNIAAAIQDLPHVAVLFSHVNSQ